MSAYNLMTTINILLDDKKDVSAIILLEDNDSFHRKFIEGPEMENATEAFMLSKILIAGLAVEEMSGLKFTEKEEIELCEFIKRYLERVSLTSSKKTRKA